MLTGELAIFRSSHACSNRRFDSSSQATMLMLFRNIQHEAALARLRPALPIQTDAAVESDCHREQHQKTNLSTPVAVMTAQLPAQQCLHS